MPFMSPLASSLRRRGLAVAAAAAAATVGSAKLSRPTSCCRGTLLCFADYSYNRRYSAAVSQNNIVSDTEALHGIGFAKYCGFKRCY